MAAALALAGGTRPWAVRAGARTGGKAEPLAFLALGDVHFDRPEHHDLEWLRKDHPDDVHQVANTTGSSCSTSVRTSARPPT